MRGKKLIIGLALCALCVGRACALEYTMDAPEDYLFGRSTSVEIVCGQEEAPNVDRSKNVSLIPPGFGTSTSYLPGSGEYLTPNLVPGTLNGGLVNAIGTGTGAAGYVSADTSGGTAVAYPAVSAASVSAIPYPASPAGTVTQSCEGPDYAADGYYDGYGGISFTAVTENLYYSGGYLGTLKIPVIGVNTRIYEGTDNAQLAKGAGHFTDTSIWNGNVSLAAHNRGTNAIFGSIHTLKPGNTITLTTKLGIRTYAVESVKKITETDSSDTAGTRGNCITLFTCVRDERDYRWCVRAVEI